MFITEDLAVHGEDGEKGKRSFFASEGSKCKHKHSPRAMSSAGWGRGEPPEPADEAGGAKPQLNAGSLVL
jgi:hypothetical protein